MILLVTLTVAFLSSDLSHAEGHLSYYVAGKDGEDPAFFTGDTLVSEDYFHFGRTAIVFLLEDFSVGELIIDIPLNLGIK